MALESTPLAPRALTSTSRAPNCAKLRPGTPASNATTESTGLLAISACVTMVTAAGAFMSESLAKDALTTARSAYPSNITMSTCCGAFPPTCRSWVQSWKPLARAVIRYGPTAVTSSRYSPVGPVTARATNREESERVTSTFGSGAPAASRTTPDNWPTGCCAAATNDVCATSRTIATAYLMGVSCQALVTAEQEHTS